MTRRSDIGNWQTDSGPVDWQDRWGYQHTVDPFEDDKERHLGLVDGEHI